MSSWGCPHEWKGYCQRVSGRECDPGMKGCVLFGRFRWADESKNRPRSASPMAGDGQQDASKQTDYGVDGSARQNPRD